MTASDRAIHSVAALMLAAMAPASVWEVRRSESSGVTGTTAKKTG